MAIDTQAKRLSAVATRRLPWMRRFIPQPDGSVDQADRQQVAFVYRGIAAAELVVPVDPTPWLPVVNDRNWQWNRLPQSNWEPVVNDRNWSAKNDL